MVKTSTMYYSRHYVPTVVALYHYLDVILHTPTEWAEVTALHGRTSYILSSEVKYTWEGHASLYMGYLYMGRE